MSYKGIASLFTAFALIFGSSLSSPTVIADNTVSTTTRPVTSHLELHNVPYDLEPKDGIAAESKPHLIVENKIFDDSDDARGQVVRVTLRLEGENLYSALYQNIQKMCRRNFKEQGKLLKAYFRMVRKFDAVIWNLYKHLWIFCYSAEYK